MEEEEASDWRDQRVPKRRYKEEPRIKHLMRKCETIKNKEKIMKAPREKAQVLY